MGQFVADPSVLTREGSRVNDLKNEFVRNHQNMSQKVTEMLSGDYISPAAREVGNKIKSYDETLNSMAQAMGEYGDFLLGAGKTVNKNEQDIIDSLRNNNNTNIN